MQLFNRFLTKKECRILADESSRVARKYRHFKEFLDHNHACLSGIADLENLYHGGAAFEIDQVIRTCDEIIQATHDLTQCLIQLAGGHYEALLPAAEKIIAGIQRQLAERPNFALIPLTCCPWKKSSGTWSAVHPPEEFMGRLANMWGGYLGIPLKPTDARADVGAT